MNIFDAHCDTVYKAMLSGENLYRNNLHIDFFRMSEYDSYTQFFAVWLENEENAMKNFIEMADWFDSEIEKNKKIAEKCLSYSDMKKAHDIGKAAAFLTVEGAYMINSREDADYIFKRGVRCVSLTWNGKNRLAAGADKIGGLTDFGKEITKYMQNIGIIIDVSHLNETSFWDVMKISEKPVIASHSDSKSICNHRRNLTDEQVRTICGAGGCVGINLYSDFLSSDRNVCLEDVKNHILHFINIGGEDGIGLGTDFDGMERMPYELKGVQDLKKIPFVLKKAGLSALQVEKIMHLNFERVLKSSIDF